MEVALSQLVQSHKIFVTLLLCVDELKTRSVAIEFLVLNQKVVQRLLTAHIAFNQNDTESCFVVPSIVNDFVCGSYFFA